MASPETVLSNIKQTIATTFKGYQTLDWNVIASTRTDDFVYQFLPQALGAPSQDKEAYKATFFNVLKPGFTKFDVKNKTHFPYLCFADERCRRKPSRRHMTLSNGRRLCMVKSKSMG